MLKKIDCVMIKVDDLAKAREFYVRVFGMREKWSDFAEGSVGLQFPESDTEIVLHSIDSIPAKVDVTYLVDDVPAAVARFEGEGCTVIAAPFDVAIGKCAVIIDPFGTPLSLIDMTNPDGVKARGGSG